MAVAANELRLRETGTSVVIDVLESLRTVPGIWIDEVGGANAPGTGTLRVSALGLARWRAPASRLFGPAVDVSAGGSFVLESDGDPARWVAVTSSTADLPSADADARVELSDVANNDLGGADRAADGFTAMTPYTLDIQNLNAVDAINNLAVWLSATEPTTAELTLKVGAVNIGRPTTEAAALLVMPGTTIAASAAATLTVSAVTLNRALPWRVIRLFASWDDGAGGRTRCEFRGVHRAYDPNNIPYAFYRADGSDPDPDGTPFATANSLPNTPTPTFADGEWRIGVARINRFGLNSGFSDRHRLLLSGGTEQTIPPVGPLGAFLTQAAGGAVLLDAVAQRPSDTARQADTWAIWVTSDGSTPNTDAAATSTARLIYAGLARLRKFSLGTFAHGTVVKAAVKTRNGSTDSTTQSDATLTVDTTAPIAVPNVGGFEGRP